ncbi:divergent polysaccharide deacetylase family protein [Escherichia coli]
MVLGIARTTKTQVLAMPSAISVAVLPDSPHAREMATKAHNSGHEVLIISRWHHGATAAGEKYAAPGDEQRRN